MKGDIDGSAVDGNFDGSCVLGGFEGRWDGCVEGVIVGEEVNGWIVG